MSGDFSEFHIGDDVTHRLTGWFGIIVGERNYGEKLDVMFVSPTVADGIPFTIEVPAVALEHFDYDEPKDGEEVVDNVIKVNFTKKIKLKKDTPTEGAA